MIKHTDYLVLLGGTDISPHHYNEPAHPMTDIPDDTRDTNEFSAVISAIEQGIPIIGICRGAQLLCAVNGGKLDQHNPKHRGNNHPILTQDGGIIINVAADHHQTMLPSGDFVLYGVSLEDNIPEVVYWPATKCLAVQPHPEWNPVDHPFNLWLNDLMKKLDIPYVF